MVKARSRERWDHTAALMWLIANTVRQAAGAKKTIPIDKFHPHRVRAKKAVLRMSAKAEDELLDKLFGGK